MMSVIRGGIVLRQLDRLLGEGTLTGLGDGQLLERYLSRRDEDAFAALVDLHGPMVLGLCRRMLRDPRDIEDAFQATFLVLVRKAPAIRDRDLLSSWLYGVALRVARRARSRAIRLRDREATVGVPEAAAELESADRPEIDPMLDQELGRLPERYRAPLVLCYLRGRTHEQAAEDLRCPVGTVRSRLARGRDMLRKRLTRRGFVPSPLAALWSTDPALPARLLLADVPRSLAEATVRAAVAFGSSSFFKAGAAAASSVVLARGVLTTMKLAQLKWIGLATLMTSLSAGVVASGWAAAPQKAAATVPVAAPQEKPTGTKDELKDLRDKVDSLTKDNDRKTTEIANLQDRLRAMSDDHNRERENLSKLVREWRDRAERAEMKAPSPDRRGEPTASGTARPSSRVGEDAEPIARSISQLETSLILARDEYIRVDELFRQATVSTHVRDSARGKVLLIVAQVEAVEEETQDELDRLKLERQRKAAQLEKAEAEMEEAATFVSRDRRLNERKPGMVGPEEVVRHEAAYKVNMAQNRIAKVDLDEVDLRIRQWERRRERMRPLIDLARQVKDRVGPFGTSPASPK